MDLVLSTAVILTVFLLMLRCQAFIVNEVLVNEPVTFLCNCFGKQSVVEWTRFIPSKAVIAKCDRQTCQIEQPHQKRFNISGDTSKGNFSMTISSATYNDAGSYMCTSDGDLVTDYKLKVYVPTVLKAVEGENITLPCYRDTRQGVKDVKWKNAGRTMLVYTHENRSVMTDEALEGRFMMSVEGFLNGDLSLHITSVHLSDKGIYRCLLHDESQEGEPRAVLLMVDGPRQLTTTHTNYVLFVLLGFLTIIGVIVYLVKRYRTSHPHNQAIPDEESLSQ